MFNKRKTKKQEIKELIELRNLTQSKIDEYKELELSIHKQLDELYETIDIAKNYLALCGINEKDLERIMIKNRLKVVDKGR